MSEQQIVKIPAFSLKRQNLELRAALRECFLNVVDQSQFILGNHVSALEKKIAAWCGVNHGVGVGNGSDALYLALQALGITPGDEVITTPFTFFATAGAISRVGAKPVFVDIEKTTWNMNPMKLKAAITKGTKAIIPVHLYGCPANMSEIMLVASTHDLKVVEDSAQALGAKFKEMSVGSWGDAGCVSFFPTKVLGAFGDGGMVVTNDSELASRISRLRLHGSRIKYHHDEIGSNSRLDELQAAILHLKSEYSEQWTERRRSIADLYGRLFGEYANQLGIRLPVEPAGTYHVYHQYTIAIAYRDRLHQYLTDCGIGSAIYYPVPLHLQPVYSSLGYSHGDFPEAEAASRQVLSLPMFPELTDEEVNVVVAAVVRGCKESLIGMDN